MRIIIIAQSILRLQQREADSLPYRKLPGGCGRWEGGEFDMNRLLDWLEDLEDWMYDHSQALMTIGVPLVEVIIALIILKFIIW